MTKDSLNAISLLKELRDTTPITAQRKCIDAFFAAMADASTRKDEGLAAKAVASETSATPPLSYDVVSNSLPQCVSVFGTRSEISDAKTHMTKEWEAYRDGWARLGVDVTQEHHAFLHGYMAAPTREPVSVSLIECAAAIAAIDCTIDEDDAVLFAEAALKVAGVIYVD